MQIFKSASTAMLTVGEVEEREGGREREREGVVVRRASHHDAAGRGQRADRSSGGWLPVQATHNGGGGRGDGGQTTSLPKRKRGEEGKNY